MKTTHTYALLEISHAAWAEIKAKLLEAGYDHAINEAGEIDMQGLALIASADAMAQEAILDSCINIVRKHWSEKTQLKEMEKLRASLSRR